MTTQITHQDSLTMALEYAGGAIGLAKKINALGTTSIRYQSIQGWKNRGYIPPSSFVIVEKATDGTVTMQEMLNDFVKAKQGANQQEAPNEKECPAAGSGHAAEIATVESNAATEGSAAQ